jgi:hypothetical protein
MPTITSDQTGAYELTLDPGTPLVVDVDPRSRVGGSDVTVFVHAATVAVYVRIGADVSAADPYALIAPVGTWTDVQIPESEPRIALVSAAAATVSVARS